MCIASPTLASDMLCDCVTAGLSMYTFYDTQCDRHATKPPQSTLALGPRTGARALHWAAQQGAGTCLARSCAPSEHAVRQCAEQLQQSAPAGGPGMVS